MADPDPDANGAGWNKTAVTVSFIAADGLSGVSTVTGPITFAGEGAGQVANGTATDKAGNSASTGSVINIDLTAPEAKNVFNSDTLTVDVLGQDPLSGTSPDSVVADCLPTSWGERSEKSSKKSEKSGKGPDAELCTYTITDAAGNVTVLVEKRKQTGSGGSAKGSSKKSDKSGKGGGGGEVQIEVVTVQYNGGDVIEFPPKADKKFEWSLNSDGTLKELEQKMELGKGNTKQQVTAHYSSKDNETEFNIHGDPGRLVGDGLRLLCMVTEDGELRITFDSDELVRKGGGSEKSGKSEESSEEGSTKSSKKSSSKSSGKS